MAHAVMPFLDPDGTRLGFPTFPWGLVPDGLATRRQLRAAGLRPGGQPVRAQIMWRSRRSRTGIRLAYLYEVALAKPKRTATPRQMDAIGKALRARRICPDCGVEQPYCIPTRYGACLDCHGWELTA
uniref:RRQRL motif-containing zinc-binding protein n=1 Tax=Sphaerisporangium sp. CA-236357 TaxID=3240030 RepID=UPI003F491011